MLSAIINYIIMLIYSFTSLHLRLSTNSTFLDKWLSSIISLSLVAFALNASHNPTVSKPLLPLVSAFLPLAEIKLSEYKPLPFLTFISPLASFSNKSSGLFEICDQSIETTSLFFTDIVLSPRVMFPSSSINASSMP